MVAGLESSEGSVGLSSVMSGASAGMAMTGARWTAPPFSLQHFMWLGLGSLTAWQAQGSLWPAYMAVDRPEKEFQEDPAGMTCCLWLRLGSAVASLLSHESKRGHRASPDSRGWGHSRA